MAHSFTMWTPVMIPLVFIAGLAVIALVVAFAVMLLLWIFRALGGRSKATMSREEMGLVQEIHLSLGEMEKRVEALETILLEHFKQR